MKTMAAVVVLMVLGASGAGAVDIQGKWGIGAGLLNRGGEVSLLRGRSARSAWLFDVAGSLREQADRWAPPWPYVTPTTNSTTFSFSAGPGYRRFVRPDDEISPYWDIHLRGKYGQDHRGGQEFLTNTTAGVEAEFAFGLEYFTRWHFSVAAHSSLATLSWVHDRASQSSQGTVYRSTGHATAAGIALSPAIFVRGYF